MKKTYLLLLLQFICFYALSQTENQQINNRSLDKKILDKAILNVTYRQTSVSDVANPEKKKENIMLLEIGKNVSKYYDQQQYMADSLRAAHVKQKMNSDKSSKIIVPLLHGSIAENVFKNFPKNKITITDRIPFNTYQYEEDFVSPDWKLVGGSCTLCGYECKKALTTYRGRNYIAWYAPEITLSDGPWKFSGLPGLILKIEDEQKHYFFECIGIEQPKDKNIFFSLAYRYIHTTKEKFQKANQEFHKNPGAHMANSGLVQSEMPAHTYKEHPYNPIERSE